MFLLWFASPAPGRAAPPGPQSFATGFVDGLFQNPAADPGQRWARTARRINATWLRLEASWVRIAPNRLPKDFRASDPRDPHYDWFPVDLPVEYAAAAHERILLQIFTAPAWAAGPHRPRSAFAGTWRPDARMLGQFAHALALRFSGHYPDPYRPGHKLPRVTFYQVWNEPNLPTTLAPQWVRSGGSWRPASPGIYRSMLNAAYAGIKAAQPAAYVLAAGTAPYGDPPGGFRMPPVIFDRELLCLHGAALTPENCPHPAHLDALDHHPYSANATRSAADPDNVSVPDFGRLWRVLRRAQRTGGVLPAGPKAIWATEIDWDTNPPDAGSVSLAMQTRYLSQAFYEMWRQGIGHVFWFLMKDVPKYVAVPVPGAGLYFNSGRAKLAAGAFAFPFVALPDAREGTVTFWGRAPHPGTVAIQLGSGHGWPTVLKVPTTSGGVFYVRRRMGLHLVFRALQGRLASRGYAEGRA
ncbi:MAG: hypothetical protein ACYC91_01380 [Solirubrobacteraceae bacterium]